MDVESILQAKSKGNVNSDAPDDRLLFGMRSYTPTDVDLVFEIPETSSILITSSCSYK